MSKKNLEVMEVEAVEVETVDTQNKEISIDDIYLSQSIAKVDVVEVELKKVAEEYSLLVQKPIESAEEYKAVYDAHQDVKSRRLAITTEETKIKRAIDNVKKKFVSHIAGYLDILGVEKQLEESRKVWEKKEEDRKNAEKIAKQQALDERVEKVKAAGAVFDSDYYTCGAISVSLFDIEKFTDSRFDKMIESIEAQKKVLDELAKQAEEAEAKRLAEEAEAKRLAEEARVQQEEENKKMKAQILEMRTMMMQAHGLEIKENAYYFLGVDIVKVSDLENFTDADFMAFSANVVNRKAEIQKQNDENKLFETNANILVSKGLVFDGLRKVFVYVNEFETLEITKEEVLSITDELLSSIDTQIEGIKTKIDAKIAEELKDKEEAEKEAEKQAEAYRQNTLSDEQKYNEYLQALKNIKAPVLTTPLYQNKVEIITNILNR